VEGIVRVTLCVALWLANVKDPGYYGVAMAVGSGFAILVALRGQHGLIGPDAPWSELSSALGYLLVTSVLTQLRLNVGPIAIKLLATPAEAARTGPFLNSLIIARVPLFFFQAVQAALLPKLAGYASTGRHADLRRALRRLLALCLRRRCSSHGGHLRAPALGGPVPLLVRALIWVTPTWAPWPWPAPATWWRSS
jgi:O-antigen/teichoic acid export membrane protein